MFYPTLFSLEPPFPAVLKVYKEGPARSLFQFYPVEILSLSELGEAKRGSPNGGAIQEVLPITHRKGHSNKVPRVIMMDIEVRYPKPMNVNTPILASKNNVAR